MDFLWKADITSCQFSIFNSKGVIMRGLTLAVLWLLASIFVAQAQPHLVKVRVRVVLVDRELNQKPVPFLLVSLKSGSKSLDVKTGLDGTAEANLPAGKYTIVTPKPAELGGQRFSWNVAAMLVGTEQNVDLTNDNARSEEISKGTATYASG